MTASIINGTELSRKILDELKIKIDKDRFKLKKLPKLAIILIGQDVASKIYVNNKIRVAKDIGISIELLNLKTNITQIELLNKIENLNQDSSISGIIVQMPLPNHINILTIVKSIDPSKDVDGFHPLNIGSLYSPYEHGLVACTAMGCLELIKHCCDNLSGKKATIIGRSSIVGRPVAALLLKENCTVTICHSHTKNLKEISLGSDIIISAIGKANFFTKEYFNSNAIIIDVGINRINGKITGDVDFDNVKNKVKYITPVPGGVGPMTIAFLLLNTYEANFRQESDS